MISQVIEPRILYYGMPVILLTTSSAQQVHNISVMSSSWALGHHVILGMAENGQGFRNLQDTGECVINVPDAPLWKQVMLLGRSTGSSPVPEDKQQQGYQHVADKFALAGFSSLASDLVSPPRIKECPLQLEARLLGVQPFTPTARNPDPGCAVVEVEVIRVHAHQDLVVPGTQHIDPLRWNPLFYVFRHFTTSLHIEKTPWAEV